MKKNKLKNFLFIGILIFSPPTYAEFVWVHFSHNKVATFFYDPSTLKENKHFKDIWILANYTKPNRSGEHSVIVKQKFDCKRARYKIMRLESHALKNGKGPVITEYPGQKQWRPVVSSTPDSDLLKIICLK
jgi:hypothetical protein